MAKVNRNKSSPAAVPIAIPIATPKVEQSYYDHIYEVPFDVNKNVVCAYMIDGQKKYKGITFKEMLKLSRNKTKELNKIKKEKGKNE